MFKHCSEEYHQCNGERHLRLVSDNCWISVLHRMTGFCWMEWETAICFYDPELKKHKKGSPFIVCGDWRNELSDMPESELMAWYESKRPDNPTSFDAVMSVLRDEDHEDV